MAIDSWYVKYNPFTYAVRDGYAAAAALSGGLEAKDNQAFDSTASASLTKHERTWGEFVTSGVTLSALGGPVAATMVLSAPEIQQNYVAPAYAAKVPDAGSSAERAAALQAQKDEANRLTENVVNHIAPNTEITLTAAANTTELLTPLAVGKVTGGLRAQGLMPKALDKAISGKTSLAFMGATAVPGFAGYEIPLGSTGIVDAILKADGEAPLMSWVNVTPGFKWMGDEHYVNGGTPQNYPGVNGTPAAEPSAQDIESLLSKLDSQLGDDEQALAAAPSQPRQFQSTGGGIGGFFSGIINAISSLFTNLGSMISGLFTSENATPPAPVAAAAPTASAAAPTELPATQDITMSYPVSPPPHIPRNFELAAKER